MAFIKRSFFSARLRLKNSAVVERLTHNLKVPGSSLQVDEDLFLIIFLDLCKSAV